MSANLQFRIDSLMDPAKRVAWVDLLREIFGHDFTAFSKLDIWPADYRAFSYLEGDVIVANISCNPLPLRLAGRDILAAQLQGVATRPAYRRQGLFRTLMERALRFADATYECLLLYTETPALYQPFGFRLLPEHSFVGRLAGPAPEQARPEVQTLSIRRLSDLARLRSVFRRRRPVSDRLGLIDNEPVFLSNLLMFPEFRLRYLPESEAVVVWDQAGAGSTCRLLDILAADIPPMAALAAALDLPAPDAPIDVLFPPDRLTGRFSPRPFQHDQRDQLMVRGAFAIEGEAFMLPLTALS